MKDWESLEEEIKVHFPGVRTTKGSGALWGDGDKVGNGISFEAKHQKRVSFDSWWGQTRRQAARYDKVPCLVIQRPPAKLDHSYSISDEILAVVPLWYLGNLHQKIQELESEE